MKTGRDFKLARQGKDIKLKQIAEHLNCSIAYISYFENNKRDMSKKKIEQYKKFLEEF